jgi:hypothetical protein
MSDEGNHEFRTVGRSGLWASRPFRSLAAAEADAKARSVSFGGMRVEWRVVGVWCPVDDPMLPGFGEDR